MGFPQPLERLHLPLPALSYPCIESSRSAASTQAVCALDDSLSDSERRLIEEFILQKPLDPWSLNRLPEALRSRPEVLKAVAASGHPEAMKAISFYVPPDILRRPEIYDWLKDYRKGALPRWMAYFQASAGMAVDSHREFWELGGDFGAGGRRWATGFSYRLRLPIEGGSKTPNPQVLGMDASLLLYPRKRISMLESQSILALGVPVAREFSGNSRKMELGFSLTYYYARGIEVALPSWGVGLKVLNDWENETWNTSFDLHLPLWTLARGLDRLAQGISKL